jgi:hypothetical protein
MSCIPYELALIRQDQLLREAAERRLATLAEPSALGGAGATTSRRSHRLPRLKWLVRASQVPPPRAARGY